MISSIARLSTTLFLFSSMVSPVFAASVFSAKEGTSLYQAKVEKDSVNLRTKPSVKASKASKKLSQGAALEVRDSSEKDWLEIVSPEAYRGLFIRQDMVNLSEELPKESQNSPLVPTAPAVTISGGESRSKSELRSFRASFMPVLASNGNNVYTGIVNWVPSYVFLNGRAQAGLDLGLTGLKSRSGSRFLAAEYAARGEYVWTDKWSTELLLGAQSWFKSPYKTALMVGTGVSYRLPQPVFHFLERVVLDYTPVFQSITAHEIRIGAGFTL
ncbi:MAG: SH3 domain-containing protein [Bdellovibrionia bacterium]